MGLAYLESGILEANPKGQHRYRAKIGSTENCMPFIKRLRARVTDFFQLQSCPLDSPLGVGYFIH